VTKFFLQYSQVIDSADLHEYLHLTYNCDEIGLSSVPNNGCKVIAQKGIRCVQQVTVGERGSLTTCLPCVNGQGEYLPLFLIYKHLAPDYENYPENPTIASSKSGYIDKDVFLIF
jgi:hypothetical protein